MLKIKVECVGCGFKKDVGQEQKDMPMCDKCFMPMVTIGAEIRDGYIRKEKNDGREI